MEQNGGKRRLLVVLVVVITVGDEPEETAEEERNEPGLEPLSELFPLPVTAVGSTTPNGSTKPTVSGNRNECSPLRRPFGVRGGGEVPVAPLLVAV